MVETSTKRVRIPENIVRNVGFRRYIKLNKKNKELKSVGSSGGRLAGEGMGGHSNKLGGPGGPRWDGDVGAKT